MKKLLIVLVVLSGVLLGGCGLTGGTYNERLRRDQQINDFQARQLVDDWDYFWLYERNSHLTEYHPRVGL